MHIVNMTGLTSTMIDADRKMFVELARLIILCYVTDYLNYYILTITGMYITNKPISVLNISIFLLSKL